MNTLQWESPASLCPEEGADVQAYDLYYARNEESEFSLIASIDDPSIINFEHRAENGLAGCYKIVAIDTLGNRSPFSNTVCVDNCPFYQLPNTFTPNGDGQNDLFTPFPYCFITSVKFKAFNRWGQVVFETSDPAINWDGNNLAGQALASGTYYYTCAVFENRFSNEEQSSQLLSGFIELIRED